jgi:phage tail protein X
MIVRLIERGLQAARDYGRLAGMIEARWEARYGRDTVACLRDGLEVLFTPSSDDMAPLAQALIPPPGTARAAEEVPALGRRAVGAGACATWRRKPGYSCVITLPYYPLWDMNRGFGP